MVKIYFDGGAKPNPGIGYGSYEISDGTVRMLKRWKAPFTIIPNNRAEYLTLWLALHDLFGKFPGQTRHVEIFSDSKLLVNQISGKWKAHDERIKMLHSSICFLLQRIPNWSIHWNSRDVNVEKFGH